MSRVVNKDEPFANASVASGIAQRMFGALVRKNLRNQGATAFVPGARTQKQERAERESHRRANAVHSCQHRVLLHEPAPHPRYGDAVPYFDSYVKRDIGLCVCKEAKERRAERAMQPAQAAPKAPEPVKGDSGTGPVQCSGTTKLKLRCRTMTLNRSGLCTKHG